MAVATLLLRRALSSCHHDVYIRCLLSSSDLHSMVNSSNLRFWRGYHNYGKFDFTDMTDPHMWYLNAREKKRKVFLHVGPTNSGKTHNALKRLEASSSGVYCGPLRLLAREVAKRLNNADVPCNLITGQEREEIEGAKHSSVTVEIADVTTEYQCAVIDEIQMIGCKTRGFSFTRALLGLCSDELHVCGDPAAVPIIQRMLEPTGDVVTERFLEKAKLSPDYFIADCEDMLKVAAIVDELPLGLYDKYIFCLSPVDVRDDISTQGLIQFAGNDAKKGTVRLKERFTSGTLQVPKTHNQLKELESVHKVLELYVWLGYRFEDSFPDRELAASQKSICSMLIEEYLERSGWQQQGQKRFLHNPRKLRQEYDASQLRGYFQEIDTRSK